jgi:hypothetical protein
MLYRNSCEINSTTLEPRILDYLKKVKFYKKNKIEHDPKIIQKEFAISKYDLNNIKLYKQGKPICCNNEFCNDMISSKGQKFPSSKLQDERMNRLKQKQQKEKDAVLYKNNYNAISSQYDMYDENMNFSSPASDGFAMNWMNSFTNPNEAIVVKRQGTGCFAQSNTYNVDDKSKYHKNIKTNHISPSISYNNTLQFNKNNQLVHEDYSVDSIFSQLDNYKQRPGINNAVYRRDPSDCVDVQIPRKSCTNNKKTMYLAGGDGQNIDVDTDMKFGQTPLRGGKTLGYKNTLEHSFSYISKYIQHPDHVVSERPISTRLLNKDFANPVARDMMC